MKKIVRRGEFLSLAQKLSRLAIRLRDLEWKRYGATLVTGKLLGVASTLLIITAFTGIFFTKVLAADSTVKAADVVNPVNTPGRSWRRFLFSACQSASPCLKPVSAALAKPSTC